MKIQVISYHLPNDDKWIALSMYPLPLRQKAHPHHMDIPVTMFPTTHTSALGDTREEAIQNLTSTIISLRDKLPGCEITTVEV